MPSQSTHINDYIEAINQRIKGLRDRPGWFFQSRRADKLALLIEMKAQINKAWPNNKASTLSKSERAIRGRETAAMSSRKALEHVQGAHQYWAKGGESRTKSLYMQFALMLTKAEAATEEIAVAEAEESRAAAKATGMKRRQSFEVRDLRLFPVNQQ